VAVFAGAFTTEGATAIAAWGDLNTFDIVESVSDLVARSLVTADVSHDEAIFRLLEMTRAYAGEKLTVGTENSTVHRRHAEYCRDLLDRAEARWTASTAADWPRAYGWLIDDVRRGLRWAFSPPGDAALGVELTTKSAALFFQPTRLSVTTANAGMRASWSRFSPKL
jgi:predicted ATPase